MAAYTLAILVHPTNIFLGPIVAICLAYAWRGELSRLIETVRSPRVGIAGRGVLLFFAMAVLIGIGWLAAPALQTSLARAVHPGEYADFASNLTGMISGSGVYEYFSGARGALPYIAGTALLANLVAIVVLLAILLGWLRIKDDPRRLLLRLLAIGTGVSVAAFFLVAGPGAIAPAFQRYGLWFVAPAGLLAAIGLDGSLAAAAGRYSCGIIFLAILLGWLSLVGFHYKYFNFLTQTGGESHLTFRTAAIEPKEAALEYIAAHSPGKRAVTVTAGAWWNYWPLRI